MEESNFERAWFCVFNPDDSVSSWVNKVKEGEDLPWKAGNFPKGVTIGDPVVYWRTNKDKTGGIVGTGVVKDTNITEDSNGIGRFKTQVLDWFLDHYVPREQLIELVGISRKFWQGSVFDIPLDEAKRLSNFLVELERKPLGSKEAGSDISDETVARLLSNPGDDKPTKVDLLGRQGLVTILKGIIDRDSKKHLIVALFGRWGSGKSSVIEMLRDRYAGDRKSHFIIFNAWQNEHSKNMTASIANQIIEELYKSRNILEQVWLTLKSQWIAQRASLYISMLFTAALFVGIVFFFIIDTGSATGWNLNFGSIVSLALTSTIPLVYSYFRNPFTSKIKELAKRPDFSSHIGVGHSIQQQIRNLLRANSYSFTSRFVNYFFRQKKPENEKAKEETHKYIVVIDDLDRCSMEKIIQTLEVVQLVVDLDDVVILLAVDHEKLLQAVTLRYFNQSEEIEIEEAQSTARDFLGKVLQITITLERPSQANRTNFIKNRLYRDMEEIVEDDNLIKEVEVEEVAEPEFRDILNFKGFVDSGNLKVDETDEYLQDNSFEYACFSQCAEVFDIHNPRTLIRLYNAITLLKGLYPVSVKDAESIRDYIFLVFWFEYYCSKDSYAHDEMKELLVTRVSKNTDNDLIVISGLAEAFNFYQLPQQEVHKMLYRVKNLSLPSLL